MRCPFSRVVFQRPTAACPYTIRATTPRPSSLFETPFCSFPASSDFADTGVCVRPAASSFACHAVCADASSSSSSSTAITSSRLATVSVRASPDVLLSRLLHHITIDKPDDDFSRALGVEDVLPLVPHSSVNDMLNDANSGGRVCSWAYAEILRQLLAACVTSCIHPCSWPSWLTRSNTRHASALLRSSSPSNKDAYQTPIWPESHPSRRRRGVALWVMSILRAQVHVTSPTKTRPATDKVDCAASSAALATSEYETDYSAAVRLVALLGAICIAPSAELAVRWAMCGARSSPAAAGVALSVYCRNVVSSNSNNNNNTSTISNGNVDMTVNKDAASYDNDASFSLRDQPVCTSVSVSGSSLPATSCCPISSTPLANTTTNTSGSSVEAYWLELWSQVQREDVVPFSPSPPSDLLPSCALLDVAVVECEYRAWLIHALLMCHRYQDALQVLTRMTQSSTRHSYEPASHVCLTDAHATGVVSGSVELSQRVRTLHQLPRTTALELLRCTPHALLQQNGWYTALCEALLLLLLPCPANTNRRSTCRMQCDAISGSLTNGSITTSDSDDGTNPAVHRAKSLHRSAYSAKLPSPLRVRSAVVVARLIHYLVGVYVHSGDTDTKRVHALRQLRLLLQCRRHGNGSHTKNSTHTNTLDDHRHRSADPHVCRRAADGGLDVHDLLASMLPPDKTLPELLAATHDGHRANSLGELVSAITTTVTTLTQRVQLHSVGDQASSIDGGTNNSIGDAIFCRTSNRNSNKTGATLASENGRRRDGSSRNSDSNTECDETTVCMEAAISAAVQLLVHTLAVCANRQSTLPTRTAVPGWLRRLRTRTAVRAHKYEILRSELPHASLAACLRALLLRGFLPEAVALGRCVLHFDQLDLTYYSLALLGSLYQAMRCVGATSEGVEGLYDMPHRSGTSNTRVEAAAEMENKMQSAMSVTYRCDERTSCTTCDASRTNDMSNNDVLLVQLRQCYRRRRDVFGDYEEPSTVSTAATSEEGNQVSVAVTPLVSTTSEAFMRCLLGCSARVTGGAFVLDCRHNASMFALWQHKGRVVTTARV